MISLVCRVCLAGDVRMHCIGGDLGLQEIYENVTSAKLYTEDGRPVTICYICCSLLQKCNRFAEMSRRAEKILTELVVNGLEIMQQNLSVISNLAVTPTTLISLDKYSEIESAPGAVKEEFDKAEESDLDGFETDAMLDIEPFETKASSMIDFNSCYVCDVCNESFTSESSMATHYQSHAEVNPQVISIPLSTTSSTKIHKDVNRQISFTCEHCNKAFTRKYTLMKHFVNMHHGINSYVCKQCNSSFNSHIKLQYHSRTHKIVTKKNKKYTCNTCGKIILHRSSWRRHMRAHNGEKPYACNQCPVTFTQNSSLKRHKKIHMKPPSLKKKQRHIQLLKTMKRTGENLKQYACDICSTILCTKQSLNYHYIRKHLGIKPFACDQCSKTFVLNSELKAHNRIHTGEKPYTCDYCRKSFHTRSHIQYHMRIHLVPRSTKKKEHVCDTCGKAFKSTSEMKVHIRIHTGERPYSCDCCIKTFTTKSALIVHKRIHTGEKPFVCKICDKPFTFPNSLRSHIRRHSREKGYDGNTCDNDKAATTLKPRMQKHLGEKQFVCDFCSKSYYIKYDLKRHMLLHTGKKTFTCNNCNKSFFTRASLNQHFKLHGERYYTCNVCDKKFSYPGNLKVHMTVHTGLKPYSCVQCDKSFANTSNLKAHNKVHHPELMQKAT